jgi:hypothetical protein
MGMLPLPEKFTILRYSPPPPPPPDCELATPVAPPPPPPIASTVLLFGFQSAGTVQLVPLVRNTTFVVGTRPLNIALLNIRPCS